MMTLKELFLEALDDGMEGESSIDDTVLEFPNDNFTVSIFKDTKTLLFSPQEHQSLTNKIRTLVNLIKQNFNVQQVSDKGNNTFQIIFDANEDFDSVIDWLKQQEIKKL